MVDFENDLVSTFNVYKKGLLENVFEEVFLMSGSECAYCGRKHPTTLDHVVLEQEVVNKTERI